MSNESGKIRLQKFLAQQGLASRREAERWIAGGQVTVNGAIAGLGQKVSPDKDKVVVNGKLVRPTQTRSITLAMNKPRGILCSNADPHHERTIFDLLPRDLQRHRLFCAGRLDKESEGLLILTNDGSLAQQLTHPSRQVVKRYHVTIQKPFNPDHIKILLNGVNVEGEHLKAEKIILAQKGPKQQNRLEMHLTHGRKREIRRMLQHLGYHVKRLIRFQIGGLQIRGLGSGRFKTLKDEDISLLFK